MQQQTKNHKTPKKLKTKKPKNKNRTKNYDVEISGIFTVYMRIQGVPGGM